MMCATPTMFWTPYVLPRRLAAVQVTPMFSLEMVPHQFKNNMSLTQNTAGGAKTTTTTVNTHTHTYTRTSVTVIHLLYITYARCSAHVCRMTI